MLCPYSSPQNDMVKRMIHTNNDGMCSLLFQASLLAHYWAESLHTATYLLNLFGATPSYANLQVFGCACYPNFSATAPHSSPPLLLVCLSWLLL
jgi:hypothetical protein